MPYMATRRLYNVLGRKLSKYLTYRRAKRLFNEINRGMAFCEFKYLKARLRHT